MKENEGLVKRRKTAGIISMAFGIPNLVVAAAVAFGGIALTILLGIVIIGMLNAEPSDDPIAPLCMVLLLIIIIVLLFIAVILTIVAVIFALFMGGQSIGGYRAYKGENFGRSVTLIFGGSSAALIMAMVMIIFGLGGQMKQPHHVGAFLFGIFEILSFIGGTVSGIMLFKTRPTFIKVERKRKSIREKMKERKKKK